MTKWSPNKEVMKNNLLDEKKIRKRENITYQKCFRNLTPNTIYWDPMGKKAGQQIDLRKEFYDSEKDLLEHFDYLHAQQDFSVNEAIKQIRKDTVGTGAWNLPTHYLPDVRVINPERTPFADLLPRVAVDEIDYDVTARTAHNETDVGWDIEPGSSDSGDTFADMRYPYAEPSFDSFTYELKQYGLAHVLSDVMQLASRTIRDSRQAVENSLARSIRLAEEYQIVLGTDFDSSGFDGIPDIGTEYDGSTDEEDVNISELRNLIDKSIENGADPSSLMVVTNFETHRNLRNTMDDFVRYEPTGSEINFGNQTFEFDGIPVYRSHAMKDSPSDIHTAVVPADSTYMAMMQDLNIDPMAKIGPQVDIAMSAIGALVAETGDDDTSSDHIQYISEA